MGTIYRAMLLMLILQQSWLEGQFSLAFEGGGYADKTAAMKCLIETNTAIMKILRRFRRTRYEIK